MKIRNMMVIFLAAAVLPVGTTGNARAASGSSGGVRWYTNISMQVYTGFLGGKAIYTNAGTGAEGAIFEYTAVTPKIEKSGAGSQSKAYLCTAQARCQGNSPQLGGPGHFRSTATHRYKVVFQNEVKLPSSSSPWKDISE